MLEVFSVSTCSNSELVPARTDPNSYISPTLSAIARRNAAPPAIGFARVSRRYRKEVVPVHNWQRFLRAPFRKRGEISRLSREPLPVFRHGRVESPGPLRRASRADPAAWRTR